MIRRICANCGWFIPEKTWCARRKHIVGWSTLACRIFVVQIGGGREKDER
jgi:hypothetical protein